MTDPKWAIVPMPASDEMLSVGDSAIPRFEEEHDGSRLMGVDGLAEAWGAMLSARPAVPDALVERVAERITEELLTQGFLRRDIGLTISPMQIARAAIAAIQGDEP